MIIVNCFKWITLIGVPVIMWHCYWYAEFNQENTKLMNFVVSLIVLLSVMGHLFSTQKTPYSKYVSGIAILFLISLLVSFLYWGQSPILTYRAGVTTLSILYYFVLEKFKVSEKDLQRIIFFFAGIYVLLWIYAISQAPRVVFGNLEEVTDNRGFYRILQLPSIDVLCLLYFVSFCKIVTQTKSMKWFLLAISCFAVIFLSLSRMLIFSVLIVSVFFVLRRNVKQALVIAAFLVIGFSQISQNEIVSGMTEMTESQLEGHEVNNLRITEYSNAFTAYPFHVGTMILGNGVPHIQSEYGKYDDRLKNEIGFNLSDAGYVGIYVTYGVAMILLLFFLLKRVVQGKIPMSFQPYRLFIFSLFILNTTSYKFWTFGISFAISLYALNLYDRKNDNCLQKQFKR